MTDAPTSNALQLKQSRTGSHSSREGRSARRGQDSPSRIPKWSSKPKGIPKREESSDSLVEPLTADCDTSCDSFIRFNPFPKPIHAEEQCAEAKPAPDAAQGYGDHAGQVTKSCPLSETEVGDSICGGEAAKGCPEPCGDCKNESGEAADVIAVVSAECCQDEVQKAFSPTASSTDVESQFQPGISRGKKHQLSELDSMLADKGILKCQTLDLSTPKTEITVSKPEKESKKAKKSGRSSSQSSWLKRKMKNLTLSHSEGKTPLDIQVATAKSEITAASEDRVPSFLDVPKLTKPSDAPQNGPVHPLVDVVNKRLGADETHAQPKSPNLNLQGNKPENTKTEFCPLNDMRREEGGNKIQCGPYLFNASDSIAEKSNSYLRQKAVNEHQNYKKLQSFVLHELGALICEVSNCEAEGANFSATLQEKLDARLRKIENGSTDAISDSGDCYACSEKSFSSSRTGQGDRSSSNFPIPAEGIVFQSDFARNPQTRLRNDLRLNLSSLTSPKIQAIPESIPSTRLIGELCYRLDRRVVSYVFKGQSTTSGFTSPLSPKVSARTFDARPNHYYGYSIFGLDLMMKAEVNDSSCDTSALSRELEKRKDRMKQQLSECGFDFSRHSLILLKCVNQFGILGSEGNSITSQRLVHTLINYGPSVTALADQLLYSDLRIFCACLAAISSRDPSLEGSKHRAYSMDGECIEA